MQLLKILQSDWCCQHSNDIHEDLSNITRRYFPSSTCHELLAHKTRPEPGISRSALQHLNHSATKQHQLLAKLQADSKCWCWVGNPSLTSGGWLGTT